MTNCLSKAFKPFLFSLLLLLLPSCIREAAWDADGYVVSVDVPRQWAVENGTDDSSIRLRCQKGCFPQSGYPAIYIGFLTSSDAESDGIVELWHQQVQHETEGWNPGATITIQDVQRDSLDGYSVVRGTVTGEYHSKDVYNLMYIFQSEVWVVAIDHHKPFLISGSIVFTDERDYKSRQGKAVTEMISRMIREVRVMPR